MICRFDTKIIVNDDANCKYLTGLSWDVFQAVDHLVTPNIPKPRKNLDGSIINDINY